MESLKYVGLDVHRDTISVAVLDGGGKLLMQSILATHAAALLDFVRGLRGTVHLTFEEGTHSAWLHDLLVRRVARVVVCDPRQNALLKAGNKNDKIDARKLAELLRAELLSPVYHGESGTVTLKHLRGPDQGAVSQPGHCQRGQEGLWPAASRPVAGAVNASGDASPGRTALRRVGWLALAAA